jgi:glycosyltransferase involved in cell wall biosynthesis
MGRDMAMRVSIAMTTYNSEHFVREQLESFVRQERLPDELVISDDASTDRTVEILHEFALHAPFPVCIYVNDRNLGVAQNFSRAIDRATGSIIFLSDADDCWYSQKILIMEKELDEQPQAGLAICNSDLVNERLDPLGITTWEAIDRFSPSLKLLGQIARGETYWPRMPAGSCCMAIRAKLKQLILPLPSGEKSRLSSQDHFIARAIICSGVAGAVLIPRPLLAYRCHPAQVTHTKRTPLLKKVINQLSAAHEPPYLLPLLIERLESAWTVQQCANPKIRSLALRHWSTRVNMPPSFAKRLPIVGKEILSLRYHNFSNGAVTAAKDLFFARQRSGN